MYLSSPLLPINASIPKINQQIKEALSKKDWREIEIEKPTLILVPYFLYNYHYYTEHKDDGKGIIKDTFDGILVINGHTIKIEEDLVELIKHTWKKSVQTTPKEKFEEKWNNIDRKQQHEVIQLKTAEYFDVPKQNVIVTSVRKVLLAFYLTKVKIDHQEFDIKVNALNEKIIGLEKIPSREKGLIELTKETISDLKKPKNWWIYSKELFVDTKKSISSKRKEKKEVSGESNKKEVSKKISFDLSIFSTKAVLILIILLALFLIYLALFV